MLLAGDEFRRTQRGNNNAYCLDNEISWIDWTLLKTQRELFRFTRLMIAFRKGHFNLHGGRFFTGQANERGHRDITWHGTTLNSPGWNDPTAQVLAFTLGSGVLDTEIHVMLNMSDRKNPELRDPHSTPRRAPGSRHRYGAAFPTGYRHARRRDTGADASVLRPIEERGSACSETGIGQLRAALVKCQAMEARRARWTSA